MSSGFDGGSLVDLAIALTLLEALLLAVYHHRTGRGLRSADWAATLAAGLCLMLALRAALAGAATGWIAAWLVAAGVAHVNDLRRRWR